MGSNVRREMPVDPAPMYSVLIAVEPHDQSRRRPWKLRAGPYVRLSAAQGQVSRVRKAWMGVAAVTGQVQVCVPEWADVP